MLEVNQYCCSWHATCTKCSSFSCTARIFWHGDYGDACTKPSHSLSSAQCHRWHIQSHTCRKRSSSHNKEERGVFKVSIRTVCHFISSPQVNEAHDFYSQRHRQSTQTQREASRGAVWFEPNQQTHQRLPPSLMPKRENGAFVQKCNYLHLKGAINLSSYKEPWFEMPPEKKDTAAPLQSIFIVFWFHRGINCEKKEKKKQIPRFEINWRQ